MIKMTDQEIYQMVGTWRNLPVYQQYEMFWHNLNFRASKTVALFVRHIVTSGALVQRKEVYHNYDHCLSVMMLADRLHTEITGSTKAHYALICASITHDVKHSLGKLSDDQNIENAIAVVNDYFAPSNSRSLRSFLTEVNRLISITRYPFLPENEPKTLAEKCIRDADLMYAMHPDGLESRKILERLTFEMTGQGFKEPNDYLIARAKQVEFFAGVTMYTEIGEAVRQEFLRCHSYVIS